MEPGETEEQTVLREVREETGLTDIKLIPGFKQYIKYFFKKREENAKAEQIKLESLKKTNKPSWVFKLVVFFVAETQTKDIKLSGEHIGFNWLPIDEAIKKTTFKNSKKLLKEANNFIASIKNS
jgi:8-oxo-dGTP pyrophosphatase MutT (NUDIX family)